MAQENELFIEKIVIEGLGKPINFTFRMIFGGNSKRYKIRTVHPESDFNMENTSGTDGIEFSFCDEPSLPEWLIKDKSARAKLSRAIVFGLKKQA